MQLKIHSVGNNIRLVFMKVLFVLLIIILFSCKNDTSSIAEKCFINYNGKYVIVINKKIYQMHVFQRDLKVLAVYKIGFGSNPDMAAKFYEGDKRTPEGNYFINEMLSMDAAIDSPAYLKLRNMNRHYFSAKNGYHKVGNKHADLGENAYGPRYYGISYPSKEDLKKYHRLLSKKKIPDYRGKVAGVGNGIAIHGNNDYKSIGKLCSSGCIRMFNKDVVEIGRYIQKGTPVVIVNQ